ncbi:MOSC domain-containing protein [Nostoc ellipsosporum NOK]|uniref:MOSC domain-containing protein n=1 Tax=Sphingomonas sp. IBVSS2 TaxID=1985172 RepID=UPI000A2E8458|nr:MOSC N-terminal beta barrel domain-containing protein [Sphingomonas sp. IBVSS2]MDF2384886.1 MOSC domain-containing protein [Nostoc ellipsosporum NOK]OSZ66746.1 MOSC domain-containing protein [Sphingomonas sp. IBVSS2]
MTRIVGHVRALNRFPVKSMAGERLDMAELDWQGIEGDRQYAFVRAANGTRFPWLTAREVPAMVLHRARFDDPARPKTSAVTVETPDGAAIPLRDPQLKAQLEAAAGEPAALIQVARGIYDSMPVSIQTSAGHAALEAAHGAPLAIDRFRINVIVESDVPASEWRGKRLAFGEAEEGAVVQCADPIARCVIVTIDPETGAKEPRVLRTVAREFGNAYGIYAGPARPGLIRLGDAVRLLD